MPKRPTGKSRRDMVRRRIREWAWVVAVSIAAYVAASPFHPAYGQSNPPAVGTHLANEHSIAYGCASAFRQLGADFAITYLNDKAKAYVEPLAKALDAPILMPLDVSKPGELEAVFERVRKEWGRLDILVHSITCAYLATPYVRRITGETMYVDAGVNIMA